MKSLSFRLLLFNLLLVFLPIGSFLYLDTYENQLLSSQENSMIQQGRLLASALSGIEGSNDTVDAISAEALTAEAIRILSNLGGRVDSRIRVVDSTGRLLADSAVIADQKMEQRESETLETYRMSNRAAETAESIEEPASPNASILYRMAVYPLNVIKKMFFPPQPVFSTGEFYSGRQVLLGPEVRAALEGRYGAVTRFSSGGQVSVNLYSAIPIFAGEGGEVCGAVLVSRSTYGILFNLYRLRLDIIRIFLISLAASVILSLLLSLTITGPIKKLKTEAEQVLDKSGNFSGYFRGLKRKDEIGDLSRSLSVLSLRLEKRIAFINNFISDLLHELKNPLAAIRGQVELSLSSPNREEKLLHGIAEEENRMERLLARLRELSRIDNNLEREKTEKLDLSTFISLLLERYNMELSGHPFLIFENHTAGPAWVEVNPDRLIQALTNPLDNAVSFSNGTGKIVITLNLQKENRSCLITIDDEGQGIREESGTRYFERFYTERTEKENHSGLGLAIVQAIAEGYGGSCTLENRTENGGIAGCRFSMKLPISSAANS